MKITYVYYDLGKYLRVIERYEKNRKTPIYLLCRQDNESIKLGLIKYNTSWRKYCFYPIEETIFDSNCMLDIINFMDKLNLERNKK